MTREDAIEILSEHVSIGKTCEQSCMVGFGVNIDTLDEAFDIAISALRQQETVTNRNGLNDPLTLDELREAAQTGDPVWLVRANCSSWVVIERVGDRKYHPWVDYAEFGSDEPYDFAISDYGDTFMAYRQKPEEGTV